MLILSIVIRSNFIAVRLSAKMESMKDECFRICVQLIRYEYE